MDKTIHTTVFTLKNVSFVIKDRFPLYHNGKTTEKSMGFIEHCNLFPQTFIDTSENLRSTTKNSVIFTILGCNFEHTFRKLDTARLKPVLNFINANDNTFMTIRVFKKLLPFSQFIIFCSNPKICYHLRRRVHFLKS